MSGAPASVAGLERPPWPVRRLFPLLATVVMYYAGSAVLGGSYELFYPKLLGAAAHLPAQVVRLAFALSVVLLGLLMMVTRRNAVSQVVGFMSLENGLVLAATGAKGMPLVVEISVAFSILIAFIVIGIFLFRIRERFDTVDLQALDRFRGERG